MDQLLQSDEGAHGKRVHSIEPFVLYERVHFRPSLEVIGKIQVFVPFPASNLGAPPFVFSAL